MHLPTILIFLVFTLCSSLVPAQAQTLRIDLARISAAFSILPHDMTLSPDRSLLLFTDTGQDRVLILDPDELTIKGVIGVGELSLPHDVAFDANGRLLVADSGNDRIAIYEMNTALNTAQLVETIDDLDGPEGIAVGPEGVVYIAVTLEDRVISWRDGKIITSTSSALGIDLDQPHDIEVDESGDETMLVITDPGNNRLLVFDLNLKAKREILASDPPLYEAKYVSIDDHGRLFVADQYNNAVRVFDRDAKQIAMFARQHVKLPEGILAVGDRIWVADTEGGRVLLYRLQSTP
ncbi:MAG: NHL repeat-containing protein [Magnetovibrio sp.]|nr:NHL repeat-containing protein [Magnetovibrio sp.]